MGRPVAINRSPRREVRIFMTTFYAERSVSGRPSRAESMPGFGVIAGRKTRPTLALALCPPRTISALRIAKCPRLAPVHVYFGGDFAYVGFRSTRRLSPILHRDALLPLGLDAVHLRVRPPEKHVDVVLGGTEADRADAHRERLAFPRFEQPGAQLGQQAPPGFRVRAGKQDGELVVTDPGDEVRFPQPVEYQPGDPPENGVTRRMAVPVVDGLEVVEIHVSESHRAAIAPATFDLQLQPVEECAPARDARQLVRPGPCLIPVESLLQGPEGERAQEEEAELHVGVPDGDQPRNGRPGSERESQPDTGAQECTRDARSAAHEPGQQEDRPGVEDGDRDLLSGHEVDPRHQGDQADEEDHMTPRRQPTQGRPDPGEEIQPPRAAASHVSRAPRGARDRSILQCAYLAAGDCRPGGSYALDGEISARITGA